MRKNKIMLVRIMSVLAMLAVVTSAFAIAFTFAGDELNPDAVVSYYRNSLRWSVPTDANGIAELDIFGVPSAGEEYPLIHPFSEGSYYLRITNNVAGDINYMMYIYTDREQKLPLAFDIKKSQDMYTPSVVPAELSGKKLLASAGGELTSRNMKNLVIDWKWESVSDEQDTSIGNLAVLQDIFFSVNVLVIVEDNNIYPKPEPVNVRLLHRNYVNGYPDLTFRPDADMTRSETAAIFARILANYDESKLNKIMTDFNDIPWDMWYTKYVAKLEHENIINGYPDGSFRPDDSITRAEFASICVRYYERKIEEIKKADIDFTDIDKNHWAYNSIRKAVKLGYVNGYPDGTFKPDEYITRAEVVTVVNRMLGRSADTEYVDTSREKMIEFIDLFDSHWAFYGICEAANTHYAKPREDGELWYEFQEALNEQKQ